MGTALPGSTLVVPGLLCHSRESGNPPVFCAVALPVAFPRVASPSTVIARERSDRGNLTVTPAKAGVHPTSPAADDGAFREENS